MTTFIVPADVDDPTVASGGNTYDRRVGEFAGLRLAGVAGAWPAPDADARAALAGELNRLPDGSAVLIDGLVACCTPEVVVPHADRLHVVVLVHLPLADETGIDPRLAADLDTREHRVLHAAAAVVATSAWAGRRLAEHHGLSASRVHVAPPGVDAAPLAPGGTGEPRLLCVASLTPRKGQDVLMHALAEVLDLPWTCDCVGSVRRNPGYVERLRAQVGEHQLAGRCTLLGPVTDKELDGRYAGTDLLVLPSRGETYGMVVTEALARGIPVLATDVDAVPQTLGAAPDGSRPGILVPPDDVPALGTALRRYLTDTALRDRLARSARARREQLAGWDAPARVLADVLTMELSWRG